MKPAETAFVTSSEVKLSLLTCKLFSTVLTFSSNFLFSFASCNCCFACVTWSLIVFIMFLISCVFNFLFLKSVTIFSAESIAVSAPLIAFAAIVPTTGTPTIDPRALPTVVIPACISGLLAATSTIFLTTLATGLITLL